MNAFDRTILAMDQYLVHSTAAYLRMTTPENRRKSVWERLLGWFKR